MKRYYISTTDYSGNYDGLLNSNSKGVSTDNFDEAKIVFQRESEYLSSNYELAENDGEGYYCSIFDSENADIVEMSKSYDVK